MDSATHQSREYWPRERWRGNTQAPGQNWLGMCQSPQRPTHRVPPGARSREGRRSRESVRGREVESLAAKERKRERKATEPCA